MAAKTHTYTIDSIEGNSNLGNPVFSKIGKMQNYNYPVLSPVKEGHDPLTKDEGDPTADNMQFKIKKNIMGNGS